MWGTSLDGKALQCQRRCLLIEEPLMNPKQDADNPRSLETRIQRAVTLCGDHGDLLPLHKRAIGLRFGAELNGWEVVLGLRTFDISRVTRMYFLFKELLKPYWQNDTWSTFETHGEIKIHSTRRRVDKGQYCKRSSKCGNALLDSDTFSPHLCPWRIRLFLFYLHPMKNNILQLNWPAFLRRWQ